MHVCVCVSIRSFGFACTSVNNNTCLLNCDALCRRRRRRRAAFRFLRVSHSQQDRERGQSSSSIFDGKTIRKDALK